MDNIMAMIDNGVVGELRAIDREICEFTDKE
jgi:hypothetical protein